MKEGERESKKADSSSALSGLGKIFLEQPEARHSESLSEPEVGKCEKWQETGSSHNLAT